MSKGIFITATGTDIGKTYVTGLIIKKLKQAGLNAGYYKAVLSGAEETGNGLLIGDCNHVKITAGLSEKCEDMVSYVYKTAVSPHLAAQLEGNPVTISKIQQDYQRQCLKYEYLTVEGSGGIICPIRYDKEISLFLEDIILNMGLGTLIVGDAGLGTINATVLTIRYLESKNIPVKGVILNHYKGGIMQEDNKKMIEDITQVPVIALVKEGDLELAVDSKRLISLYSPV